MRSRISGSLAGAGPSALSGIGRCRDPLAAMRVAGVNSTISAEPAPDLSGLLEQGFKASPMAMSFHRRDGTYMGVNPAWEKLFDRGAKEVIGHHFMEYTVDVDLARSAEVYDALKEAGASEEKARKAAETIADYDNQFGEIRTELKVHRWILGVLTTIGIGNLFLSFQILSRLPH